MGGTPPHDNEDESDSSSNNLTTERLSKYSSNNTKRKSSDISMSKLGKRKKNKNQEKVQPFDPNATSKGPEEFQSYMDESKEQ